MAHLQQSPDIPVTAPPPPSFVPARHASSSWHCGGPLPPHCCQRRLARWLQLASYHASALRLTSAATTQGTEAGECFAHTQQDHQGCRLPSNFVMLPASRTRIQHTRRRAGSAKTSCNNRSMTYAASQQLAACGVAETVCRKKCGVAETVCRKCAESSVQPPSGGVSVADSRHALRMAGAS